QAIKRTRGAMLDERRRYHRVPLAGSLRCSVGEREITGCSVRNVSQTGILFAANGGLQPNNKVLLSFALEPGERPVIVRGEVVRIDAAGQVGCRFLSMTAEDREQIRKWIGHEIDNL